MQQIKGGVNQMARLIDDLLALSRIGRVNRTPEPVDLSDLSRKILRLHQLEIDQCHTDVEVQDDADVDSLYDTLENKIIPLYYTERGSEDIPHKWVMMIKESLRTVTPQFSTRRMLKEYLDRLYVPAMK